MLITNGENRAAEKANEPKTDIARRTAEALRPFKNDLWDKHARKRGIRTSFSNSDIPAERWPWPEKK